MILDASAATDAGSLFRPDQARILGALCLVFYLAHALHMLVQGTAYEALWLCHLGTLCAGLGLLFRWPRVLSLGFLWQMGGLPLWLLNLAFGEVPSFSSVLTHVGGNAIALAYLLGRRLSSGSWWQGVAWAAVVVGLCRVLTPKAANINLSHGVWAGWEQHFPSHGLYLLLLSSTAFLWFGLWVRALGWWAGRGIDSTIAQS